MLVIALLALTISVSSCGGDSLKKEVKEAFIKGDTTEARYQKICEIITSNPKKYSDYVDKDGNINVDALDKMINEVGKSLRPPMTWNTKGYGGSATLSLTVYFERSGSMVPYDQPSGGGQLKKAVNDLINFFPNHQNAQINIVNDNIYPYGGTVDSFLQDRDIYASTKGIGDASFTDFKLIFDKIFEEQKPGNVAVLITDFIYSPKNTDGVSLDKIFNEENSLATSIFTKYKGKSIIVNQLSGDFDGQYYPYRGAPFQYKGRRPFYVIVIADASVMDKMAKDSNYSNFLNLVGTINSYRFNQAQAAIDYKFVPVWKNNAGRFKESRGEEGVLTDCKGDSETGILAFSVAVNLDGLQKDEGFLLDPANYDIKSQNGFTLKVERIKDSDINGNSKGYLEGMTHVLTFTGKLQSPKDEIKLNLRNDFPTWIAKSTNRDDSILTEGGFSTTTFGLEYFLRGIYDAFSASQGIYAAMSIKIEK